MAIDQKANSMINFKKIKPGVVVQIGYVDTKRKDTVIVTAMDDCEFFMGFRTKKKVTDSVGFFQIEQILGNIDDLISRI